MAFWSTKAAISLKRAQIEEKLLWGAYRNSLNFFPMVPSPIPYGLPFPKIGVRTPPKTPIAIISGTGKATNFKFGQNNNRVHPNKSPRKKLEKRERGHIKGLPNLFWVPPIISGMGKATNFKFGQYIQSIHPNKSTLKFLKKRERGRIQGLPIFGYPLLFQERVKLRTSNFACTFMGSIGTKAH